MNLIPTKQIKRRWDRCPGACQVSDVAPPPGLEHLTVVEGELTGLLLALKFLLSEGVVSQSSRRSWSQTPRDVSVARLFPRTVVIALPNELFPRRPPIRLRQSVLQSLTFREFVKVTQKVDVSWWVA